MISNLKSEQLTKKLQPCCTPCLFIMLAVKTGSKRMTKAYSKISGYDRPHVYVFVSDKKISTLESVFKNFWIRPENTLDTCGRCLKLCRETVKWFEGKMINYRENE